MQYPLHVSLAFLLAAFAFCTKSWGAEPPSLINYQGKLKRSGTNVSGEVSVNFKVFTGATNNECVFEETQHIVVTDGLYSTLIGKFPTSGSIEEASKLDEAYLEVSVNGTALKPRERFTPRPYAKQSIQRWNLFHAKFQPGCPDTDRETTLVVKAQIPGCFPRIYADQVGAETWIASATFPMPAEPVQVISSKILFPSPWLVGCPNCTPPHVLHPDAFAFTCQWKAVDFISEAERNLSPKHTLYGTNFSALAWTAIPLGTNPAELVLQPSERLKLDLWGTVCSPLYTNSDLEVTEPQFMLDVRVK